VLGGISLVEEVASAALPVLQLAVVRGSVVDCRIPVHRGPIAIFLAEGGVGEIRISAA